MPASPFGPVPFPANTDVVSPAFTVDAGDSFAQATLDCSALAAGIQRVAWAEYRRSSAGARVATASNDGNSNIISSPDASFVAGDVGRFVRGGNIPDNTTITSVLSSTQAAVSQNIGLGGQGYALTIGDPWILLGRVTGTTLGGPDHDKQGTVTEWGVRVTLPEAGVAGRQVRAGARFSQAVTASGHATSG